MLQRRPGRRTPLSLLVVVLLTGGCTQAGVVPEPVSPGPFAAATLGSRADTAAPASCSAADLPTLATGTLTVSTAEPAQRPWVLDDDPASGGGFEAAVAYAVAAQLGYPAEDVAWVRTPFADVLAPGPKAFDVALDQVSITEQRKQDVDLTSPYYDVAQAVVTVTGSAADGAASLGDLRGLVLGAQEGTTGWTAITDVVAPRPAPVPFTGIEDAAAALAQGRVDALVVDLPTAFALAADQPVGGVVVGQLARGADGGTEAVGMVLAEGSPLTACVSRAVDVLRADGTLDRLEDTWLGQQASVPVLG